MFRLTKLTPPHGWSAVAWELGIVTLGVLIALAAQQFVDGINRRSEVRQLVGGLRGELADMRARWEHVRNSDACTLQRLDALDRWIATAPKDAKLQNAYRVFLWNMHTGAWDLAKTSDTTSDIPLKQRLTFASLYDAINNWRQMISEENANTQALNALLATADQPENRSQIAYRLSLARGFVNRRKLNYDYMFRRFEALGIAPDESQLTVQVNDRAMCEPLDRTQ
jgi:anti-sigma-K factor RskA